MAATSHSNADNLKVIYFETKFEERGGGIELANPFNGTTDSDAR
jgi:hypothetical protein